MEPIQYKLIAYPGQKGEWLIISDEEIKIGDIPHPIIKNAETNFWKDYLAKYWSVRDTKKTDKYSLDAGKSTLLYIGGNKDVAGNWFYASNFNKLIASTKFIDKSIPLIRKERLIFPDEVDACIDYLKTVGAHTNPNITKCDFMAGYNKHAETHLFTLELARKIFDAGVAFANGYQKSEASYNKSNGNQKPNVELNFELFIQSLQQPKKEHIVTLLSTLGNDEDENQKLIPVIDIDKEGYITITSIK